MQVVLDYLGIKEETEHSVNFRKELNDSSLRRNKGEPYLVKDLELRYHYLQIQLLERAILTESIKEMEELAAVREAREILAKYHNT